MHDPWTVAFEINIGKPDYKFNALSKAVKSKHIHLATIWHIDPNIEGDEDSCGWHRPKLTKEELAYVDRLIDNPIDNIQSFFGDTNDVWEMKHRLRIIFRNYKSIKRHWWKHPKWHIHHWRIQIPFFQQLNRWLFKRCAKCRGRFKWNEQVIGNWGGGKIWHFRCNDCDFNTKRDCENCTKKFKCLTK